MINGGRIKLCKFFVCFLILILTSCAGNDGAKMELKSDSISIEMSPPIIDNTKKQVIQKNVILKDSVLSELHSRKIGDIVHIVEDTMFFGITDTIELTVSYNTPVNFIIERVGTFNHARHDNITTQKISLTPVMEAKLIDPSNGDFDIIPITDQTQIIEFVDSTYTLWQWRVTPLKGGMKNLVLNVNMIVGEHRKSIKIYEDKIYVHITKKDKLWAWIKLNWTYLTYLIGLMGAIFGFFYKEKILNIFKK